MAELVSQLGINWKLLLASIVNFFILLFVLKKFAYRPILGMLEKRERMVADSVKQSQAVERRLKEIEERKAEEIQLARLEAARLLERAAKSAEEVKADAVKAAQAAARRLLEKTTEELTAEREALKRSVRSDIAELVVAATEKVLREKLDRQADRRLVEQSLKQLERNKL